jgi:hypothetical protein
MTRSPLYDDSLLFSAPLHSRARAPPSVFLPLVLGGRQYGEPAGRGNPFVSPRPLPHHGDGAGPPLFATDSSYCKSEMSLIWIFGFYFDCMATILHGPRHNRCHTFPVRIIIDPCVDSSFLCYSLQWRILRWVCLLLLIALTTLLFTSLCQGLQVMCISFLQVMRYAQFWSNDSFLHSKASTLFFFSSSFQMILSLMPRLQVLFLADITHNGLMLLSNLPCTYIFFFLSSSAHLCYWIFFSTGYSEHDRLEVLSTRYWWSAESTTKSNVPWCSSRSLWFLVSS